MIPQAASRAPDAGWRFICFICELCRFSCARTMFLRLTFSLAVFERWRGFVDMLLDIEGGAEVREEGAQIGELG